jgi:solute carrier family 24 (sodium/potassium/calcium exchanger), member 6
MSENLAGVTLLAFGNGSPDIFASLSHFHGDTELMYCELIGAASFVAGFIAGVIILIRPFKIVRRNYVRDVCFFLFSAPIIAYNIHDQGYTLLEGFGTVAIYIAYIIYVVSDHIFIKRKMNKLKRVSSVTSIKNGVDVQKQVEDLEEIMEIQIKSRKSSSIILDDDILSIYRREFGGDPNENLFRTFVEAIIPVEMDEWKDAGKLSRTLLVLKVNKIFQIPLTIVLIFSIFPFLRPLSSFSFNYSFPSLIMVKISTAGQSFSTCCTLLRSLNSSFS